LNSAYEFSVLGARAYKRIKGSMHQTLRAISESGIGKLSSVAISARA
jgi:hypothetical protein